MDGKFDEFYSASSSHEEVRDVNVGYKQAYEVCPDKSLHQSFIPVDGFDLSCLPESFRNETILHLIQLMSKLTVYIHYNFQEETCDIQKTCHGTGFIQRIKRQTRKPCPCLDCKETGEKSKSWFKLSITTASSVFKRFDSQNVASAKAELFYDRESDANKTQKTQTVDVVSGESDDTEGDDETKDDLEDDWLVCFGVTHDVSLVENLMRYLEDYEKLQEAAYGWYKSEQSGGPKLVVVVGHPHGGPKRVTVGQDPRRMDIRNIRNSQILCRYAYDAATCPGSGGSPVYICGQPICGFGYWFGHPHNHARGFTHRSRDVTKQYSFSSLGMDHLE